MVVLLPTQVVLQLGQATQVVLLPPIQMVMLIHKTMTVINCQMAAVAHCMTMKQVSTVILAQRPRVSLLPLQLAVVAQQLASGRLAKGSWNLYQRECSGSNPKSSVIRRPNSRMQRSNS
jgi:hypothetical protein